MGKVYIKFDPFCMLLALLSFDCAYDQLKDSDTKRMQIAEGIKLDLGRVFKIKFATPGSGDW